MANFYYFLFFILCLFSTITFSAGRADYVIEAYQKANMDDSQGNWKTEIYCSSGWATAFHVYMDCTSYGLIGLKLYCSDWNGNSVADVYNTYSSNYDKVSWTPYAKCSSSNYIIGYKTCGCCCKHWFDNMSLNNLKMYCSNGQELGLSRDCGDTDAYGWNTNAKYCPATTALCGMRLKFDDWQSLPHDNTALNEIALRCCRICNQKSSVYPSGVNCLFCSLSCGTCEGSGSNQCTQCADSDSLISGSCVSPNNFYVISQEFTGTTLASFQTEFSGGGWSATSGFTFYDCSGSNNNWYMLGTFTGTSSTTKTLTNMIPHYKARIKVRFYKIDSWAGQSCKITVDGTTFSINALTNWQASDDSFYYGNICSGSDSENTVFVSQEFTHKTNSMSIVFSSTLTAANTNAFWGISHLEVSIFRCHETCKLCTGDGSDKCTACYDHATLASGSCTCDNMYYPVTVSQYSCTSAICTVCTPCPTGCYICSGPGPNQCTACLTDYYLYNNDCVNVCPAPPIDLKGDPATLTCVSDCKSDEYYDANRVCRKCDSTCFTCFGSSTYCTSCTGNRYLEDNQCKIQCSVNHYGVYSTHTCELDCEDYYFKHDVDNLCYKVCPSGYFGNVLTKFCVSSCPSGMYSDARTVRCQYCDFKCQTCTSSPTNCDSCKLTWLVGSSCSNPSYTQMLDSKAFTATVMNNAYITTTLGFTISGPTNPANLANYCGALNYLVGGPGILSSDLISKTYSSLVPHFRARVSFFFMKIDDWNGESVKVLIDDSSIPTGVSFDSTKDTSVMKICGTQSFTEAIRPVDLVFDHSADTLKLDITSTLTVAASVASWGIFDLSVSIDLCNNAYCASCTGPTTSDCLSCITGLFLQVSPGPSTCETLCPDGFYSDATTNTCLACDGVCVTCFGPLDSNCITCPDGEFLTINKNSYTCSSCAPGTYPDSSGICYNCDPNCLTCFGGSSNECNTCENNKYFFDYQCFLQCPDGYFGVNDTMTCNTTCPNKTFGKTGSNTCWPCYKDCEKCVGLGEYECTVCSTNLLLEEGKCRNPCSNDHFANPANSSCDVCVEFCSNCSSLALCSACKDPYYLKVPFNVSCLNCNDLGEFKDNSTKLCYVCDTNCEICASKSTCKQCKSGYYLSSNSICLPQKTLYPELKITTDPKIVEMESNYPWDSNLISKINSSMSMSISSFDSSQFSYILNSSSTADDILTLTFTFQKDVEAGDILKVIFNIVDGPNDEYLFGSKEIALALSLYCLPPKTYLISAGKCVDSITVTPSLTITSKDTTLLLQFSNNYGLLYDNYKAFSLITIEGFNTSDFNYSITKAQGYTDVFYINLNFSISFSNKPLLTLNLNPPASYQYDQSTSLRLSTTEVHVNLADHYELSQSTKQLVEDTNSATNSLSDAAGTAFAANNFVSAGGAFAIRSLVSMDVIRFLRFFLVDYPPNVLAMFQTNLPTSDFIPNVQMEENEDEGVQLPEIFQSYDLSIYIFNNTGNVLIESFCYIGTGLAILLFLKLFHSTSNRYFKLVLLIFRMVFVWNYALSYFLSTFMNFSLCTFLFYRYPTRNSSAGFFNIGFSVLNGLIIVWIAYLCFNVITKLREHFHLKGLYSGQGSKVIPVTKKENEDIPVNPKRKIFFLNEPETAVLHDPSSSDKLSSGKEKDSSSMVLQKDNKKDISSFDQSPHRGSSMKDLKELEKPVKEISLFRDLNKKDENNESEIRLKKIPLIENINAFDKKEVDTPKTNNGELSPQMLFFFPERSFLKSPKNNNPFQSDIREFNISPSKFSNNQSFNGEKGQKDLNETFAPKEINENTEILKKDELILQEEEEKEEEKKQEDFNDNVENKQKIVENNNRSDGENSPGIEENYNGSKETIQKPSEKMKSSVLNRQSNHSTQIIEEKKPKLIPFIFRKLSKSLGLALSSPFANSNGNSSDKPSWLSGLKNKLKNIVSKKKPMADWRAHSDEIGKFTEKLEALNKEFSPLHKDFKHNRALQSYYLMFDLLRQCVFSALVVGLFDSPFTGILIVNIINFGYIAVFLFIKPFKEKIDFIQGILNEVCLILVSICALILITMERIHVYDLELRMNLGWVMVAANFFLMGFFLVRIFASLSFMAFLLFKFIFNKLKIKFQKKKNQIVPEKTASENVENKQNGERKKSDEGAILQQIIDIENFLR